MEENNQDAAPEPQQSKPLGTQEPNGIDASEQGHPQSPPQPEQRIPGEENCRQTALLPRYKSHKVVRAAKIVGMSQHGDPAVGVPVSRVVLVLDLTGELLMDYDVEPKWLDRAVLSANGQDLVGGYLVHYSDDYESWSPAAAFEGGFKRLEQADAPAPATGRLITTHQVNDANRQLQIEAVDEPGAGGANHHYRITGFDSGSNPSDPFTARHGTAAVHSTVLFQNGPIGEVGVNGVTQEALLAIVVDRLEAFQKGRFACNENAMALRYLEEALRHLQSRTRRRQTAGTEGTHQGS